jgi:hypothetical protein
MLDSGADCSVTGIDNIKMKRIKMENSFSSGKEDQ